MGEIKNRLKRLESNAASILPPDGAALARQMGRIPWADHKAWLAALSAEQFAALCAEADRAWVVNGWPPIDFAQFTNEQLDSILTMNETQCRRFLTGDFSEIQGATV